MDSYITGTSCCVRIREGVIGIIKVANMEERSFNIGRWNHASSQFCYSPTLGQLCEGTEMMTGRVVELVIQYVSLCCE